MIRPLLKWVVYPSFVSAVSVLSLQAFAQKDIVPFDSISPVQGLRTGPIIPLPTIQMRGKEIVPKNMASPFSGSVPSGATYAPGGLRYPGDLSFHGGQTLDYTANHSFFVNPATSCPPNACWGDPIGFLHDLGYSQLTHVADQYVGDHAPGRHKRGTNYLT